MRNAITWAIAGLLTLGLGLLPTVTIVFLGETGGIRTIFGHPRGIRIDLDGFAGTEIAPFSLPWVDGPAGRPLVILDPGHGGRDPGAPGIDGAHHEKDAALGIALLVRDELLRHGRFRVAMTRERDIFRTLDDRREIARRLGADLFISFHADSALDAEAQGATIYTLSEVASDQVALKLAREENSESARDWSGLGASNSAVAAILVDLTQRETMNSSAVFADLLQRQLSPLMSFRTQYHRFAGFVVLKAPDVPSVLFETGYMSNLHDEGLLFDQAYRHKIATGVGEAVNIYFSRKKPLKNAARSAPTSG